jgi:hypothetical protein
MAESFLEAQLKRIRDMTERMNRAHKDVHDVSNELTRERTVGRYDPLCNVRDLRVYSSEPSHEDAKDRSEEHAGAARRHIPRDSVRRRR